MTPPPLTAPGPIGEYGGVVGLTEADLALADECATARLADGKRVGAKDKWGTDSLESHRWGARCEIAFARWAGIGFDWSCRSLTFKQGGDVAGIEVRKATLRYGLPLRGDEAGTVVVAVMPRESDLSEWRYDIPGWWIAGEERPEWTADPGGRRRVPFVPIRELRQMRTWPRARE